MDSSITPDIHTTLDTIINQIDQAFASQNTSNSKKVLDNTKKLNISNSVCNYEETEVQVIECYKQINSDICGFHCMFNLLGFLRHLAEDISSLKTYLVDGARFWKNYNEIYNFLQKNYPNKAELKYLENLGPLDRGHMEYLLEHHGEIKRVGGLLKEQMEMKLFIQPFYFGFGIIQSAEEDLKKLEDFVSSLTDKDNALMMFPLGITIHWSLLVILKRKDIKEVFYLDSKNIKLEHVFKGEIQAAIRELEEAEKYGREVARNEADERRQVSWMYDLRKTTEILLNVFKGKKKMIEFIIEGNIDETLNDLKAYFREDGEMNLLNESIVKKLYQWFEDEYRPQVISNNLLKPLSQSNVIDKNHFSRLDEFRGLCEEFGKKIKDSSSPDFDKKLVEDILKFIEELKLTLSKVKVID